MKKISFVLIGFIVLSSFSIFNENPKDIQAGVSEAIRTGNAKMLANYFNSTIELTVPEHEGNFSKNQAELIIKSFFAKYTPKTFTINNNGTSKGGSCYFIGTLVTTNGTFRTYYLIKNISGTNYIQQLLFELQKK